MFFKYRSRSCPTYTFVPSLLEDMLVENGGICSKGEDSQPCAIKDGALITGQNSASSKLVGEELASLLN